MVKNPPANAGDRGYIGWEDPLEKEITTHFCILAGKSHGQRILVGLVLVHAFAKESDKA